jgi:CubicO group peptidase (beta-lactamase class C family)
MPSLLPWIAPLLPIVSLAAYQPADECPVLGPTFPSDFDPLQSKSIQDAIAGFPKLVDALFESTINKANASFHIDVFSTYTNKSIYSYSHVGDTHKEALTAGKLDDETIFRIGSVSKLLTMSTLLNTAGLDVLRDPVTKYLPELGGNTERNQIIWEEVTVGALAMQQGGTGGFRKSLAWIHSCDNIF